MGYPMALNLRKNMGVEKTLLICDVSEAVLARFQEQMKGHGLIKVVKNGAEAVQQAVRLS